VQFPLFWRFTSGQTGTSTTVVPPLFYKSGKDGGLVGRSVPAAVRRNWPDRSHFVLFPAVLEFSDDKADRHSTLVLNYLHRRHGGETTDFLFPLVYWRRGAKPGAQPETSFTLFPLLHYKRTTDRRLIVSPIAFSSRSPERKAGFIPPYFWYQSKYTSASGVPPVYFDFTRLDTQERTRIYGPWVSIDSPTSRARILFPLFGRYRDDKDTARGCSPPTSSGTPPTATPCTRCSRCSGIPPGRATAPPSSGPGTGGRARRNTTRASSRFTSTPATTAGGSS
jgi:hypothetical protein